MSIFLVERKTKCYSARDSSSSSHRISVLGVSWDYQLHAGPSEAGACGLNRDRDTERAARDIPAVTLCVTAWCSHRQRWHLGWSLCHLPHFRARSDGCWDRSSEQHKAVFCYQGMFSRAKHFVNSGPGSPLWLDCTQHKTRFGEQRWLEATSLLLHLGSSWGLTGPWRRFKSPWAILAAGDG